MEPRIIACPESLAQAESLGQFMGIPLMAATFERFPDGELHVGVGEDVSGRELVLVQALAAPVAERLLELTLLADACRRTGAVGLTAVLPYFAYARQDKTKRRGEALGAEVLSRLLATAGFSKIVAVDLHSETASGWMGAQLAHVSAMRALAEAARPFVTSRSVVVSPDLGGAKRAEQVARTLGLPLAIVHKTRLSGQEVSVHNVLGEIEGRAPVLVDDLISTGGTLEAAVKALQSHGSLRDITVLATHALLVGGAVERLAHAQLQRLIVSDSIPVQATMPFEHHVVPLAPVIAPAVRQPLPGKRG